jgi:hypothetical protein
MMINFNDSNYTFLVSRLNYKSCQPELVEGESHLKQCV